MHVGRIMEEQAGNKGGNVGCIRGNKYHTEAAPHIDQEFVGPRLGRFERHQMTAQQAPHHPQSWRRKVTATPAAAAARERASTVRMYREDGILNMCV